MKNTELESPIPTFGGTDHFDISPDWIVFVSKDPHLDPATHTACSVYAIPISLKTTSLLLDTPEPRLLDVKNLRGAATSPVISPDGKSIAFLKMKEDGYESDKNRVVVFPNFGGSGQPVELFADSVGKGSWDRSPSSLVWSNDGKSLYVQAEDVVRGALFHIPLDNSLDAASDAPFKLTSSGYVLNVSPAAANSSRLFISSSSLIDSSIFAILDPESPSEIIKVSSASQEGAEFGLSENQVEELWWKGAEDHPVHAWMMKPSFFDPAKKYPLAYLIHGGPQGAWNDQWSTRWNPAVFSEQGYVVVAPNPTGSTGYGQDFTDAIRLEWGGKPYIDLVKGFEHIGKLDFVDTSRAVALGASYGGYMMNWMQGHDFGRKFKALVCHDGVFSMAAQLASDEQYFPPHDIGGWYSENKETCDKCGTHYSLPDHPTRSHGPRSGRSL